MGSLESRRLAEKQAYIGGFVQLRLISFLVQTQKKFLNRQMHAIKRQAMCIFIRINTRDR